MDLVTKFLKKLNTKQFKVIQETLEKLYRKDFFDLDIKKLQGKDNLFRVRKGNIRIIYTITKSNSVFITSIKFRDNNTY